MVYNEEEEQYKTFVEAAPDIIKDVSVGVKSIDVHDIPRNVGALTSTNASANNVVFYITTFEDIHLHVEMSAQGFKVVRTTYEESVGVDIKRATPKTHITYEQLSSLLQAYSPAYSHKFTESVFSKLRAMPSDN
eukprot:CFRG7628T1